MVGYNRQWPVAVINGRLHSPTPT